MASISFLIGIGLGLVGATLLTIKSLLSFSRTGPQIKAEIWKKYRLYSVFAMLRLVVWVFVVITWLAWVGGFTYGVWCSVNGWNLGWVGVLCAEVTVVVLVISLQFCKHLLHIPSSIVMSSNYMPSRFYRLRRYLSVTILRWVELFLWLVVLLPLLMKLFVPGLSLAETDWAEWSVFGLLLVPYLFSVWPEWVPHQKSSQVSGHLPNIVMIGCDTLRVDRFGVTGHHRDTSPFIDALIKRGRMFVNCYTPQARTAPSLLSFLTGLWPHHHGIRTNFASSKDLDENITTLPSLLSDHGYETVAVSDWAGSDLGKFKLGFDECDLPSDQWNLKYLIRQGPKDIRLFLSLFTHNRFGRFFLPEIYYLAGVPLTAHLGQRARSKISCLTGKDKPFFLDLFMATAHPPFGSEYPYYSRYSDPEYSGESKFAMARLVDPFDIIRSQREPKEAFDLDQINDLYDACVRRFDDEVRDIVHHLRACGIENNTVLVIYSDHGMELFEHDTWGQGNSAVGEASPRVPLVIVDPRNGYSGLDSRVVRTVDLFPTICDLCGIDQPSAMDGVSLKPYLDDEQLDYDLAAYSETGDWLVKPPGQQSKHQAYPGVLDLLDVSEDSGEITIKKDCLDLVNQARDRMIRRGKWKLVYFPLVNGVEYALYDLEQDPGCCHDVANLHLDVVSDLKRELLDWIGQ